MAEKKATDAAAKKADEQNVDLEKVEGSGKDGSVTVADVEEKASESSKLVNAVPVDPQTRQVVGPDGVVYPSEDPVSQDYFDSKLASCRNRDGELLFKKVPVDEEGGE